MQIALSLALVTWDLPPERPSPPPPDLRPLVVATRIAGRVAARPGPSITSPVATRLVPPPDPRLLAAAKVDDAPVDGRTPTRLSVPPPDPRPLAAATRPAVPPPDPRALAAATVDDAPVAARAPTRLAPGAPLRLVHGGTAAPDAWLAVWRGDAWVCWRPAPACFQRLELGGAVDLSLLRAEFTGPATLVLGDRSDATWRIDRGDPNPRPAAANPAAAPRAHACGPRGPLPVADADGLGFVDAPCPDAPDGEHLCVASGRAPAVRPPGGLRVRLGLELRAMDRWQQIAGSRAATSVAVLAVLGLGWDAAFGLRRERADLRAQARGGLRSLPALRSRGPLAAAEREALVAVLCGGAR